LNVNRLIKRYTDTSIHGGTIGGAIKSLEEKPAALLKAIASNQGERAPYYKETLAMSERSIDRYLQQLKELGLIEFKGDANQTGGYFLTDKAKKMAE
jgi:ATP-dependent DNA helicase RecG